MDYRKLFYFMLSGAPAFTLAIPLNYFLVHTAGLNKSIAYAIVLILQTVVNFSICRTFVFDVVPGSGFWKSFAIFLQGNIFFRLADWGLYVLLTKCFGVHYLIAQLFNVVLFSLLKFEFTKRIFERKK